MQKPQWVATSGSLKTGEAGIYTLLDFIEMTLSIFENNRQKCIIVAVSRDMYCIHGIEERCIKTFIKLNNINERKKFEDLTDWKLTKTIFQSNLYKCLFLICSFKLRGFLNGSFDLCQVSRQVELLNGQFKGGWRSWRLLFPQKKWVLCNDSCHW